MSHPRASASKNGGSLTFVVKWENSGGRGGRPNPCEWLLVVGAAGMEIEGLGSTVILQWMKCMDKQPVLDE